MPSVVRSLLLFAATALSVSAVPHDDHHGHEHAARKALPSTWYHPEGHPAYALFRRGTDGVNYPEVGSDEWQNAYPETVDTSKLPQAWVDALNAAVAAGKIADIPPSIQSAPGTNPTYPDGLEPTDPKVCSATYQCVSNATDEIWDAPDGYFGSSFDDGPTDASLPLYEFLKNNSVITTHFMIGTNILYYPDNFKYAFETLQSDIAVHTWTHPYMTTLSNLEVLGELGWTMEIIHNSTGGRLPKYWRPPYGDSDERTRSIAKEVFGLNTVIWNQDTEDWSINTQGGTTSAAVNANLKKWISGPKSPGLIILEHELYSYTVDAFIEAFPLIAQNGWKFESVARLDGGSVYQNSPDSVGDVAEAQVAESSIPFPSSSAASTSASSGPTGASSVNNNAHSQTSAASPSSSGSSSSDTSTNGALSRLATPATLVTCMSLLGAAFALS